MNSRSGFLSIPLLFLSLHYSLTHTLSHFSSTTPPEELIVKCRGFSSPQAVHGTLSYGIEINVTADEAWQIFGTLQLAKVTIPDFIAKIEVLEGDGGLGTILLTTFPPGSLFYSYEEKFIKVDNETRVKETENYKGGYLDLGFNMFVIRFEVFETGANSTFVLTTIEYDVKYGFVSNIQYVSIQQVIDIVNAVANYLIANH